MRIAIFVLCIVALIILGSQLQAGPAPVAATTTAGIQPVEPVIATSTFPEPISTVFILAGAAAMGLWKLARKFEFV